MRISVVIILFMGILIMSNSCSRHFPCGIYVNRTNKYEGVSKCTHPLFYAQSPDFLKPGLCYFLKFLYL